LKVYIPSSIIYLQTAHDGRPGLEEVIGNANINTLRAGV